MAYSWWQIVFTDISCSVKQLWSSCKVTLGTSTHAYNLIEVLTRLACYKCPGANWPSASLALEAETGHRSRPEVCVWRETSLYSLVFRVVADSPFFWFFFTKSKVLGWSELGASTLGSVNDFYKQVQLTRSSSALKFHKGCIFLLLAGACADLDRTRRAVTLHTGREQYWCSCHHLSWRVLKKNET